MNDKKQPPLFSPANEMDNEKEVIIYKATNSKNGKAYIGRTNQPLCKRKRSHERNVLRTDANARQLKFFGEKPESANYCRHFYNAIRKFGPEKFVWEIIDRVPQSKAYEAERKAIREHKTRPRNGYNWEHGGLTDFVERPGKPVNYRGDISTEEIIRLHKAGWSKRAIARHFKCDVHIIRDRLKRRGM